jgi:hypothetical protein
MSTEMKFAIARRSVRSPGRLAMGHLALAAIALTSGSAIADDDAIATDRPDFVESSRTVGKGRVQIETSVAFERDTTSGIKATLSSTPTLLRIGVSETLELRIETDGAMVLRESGTRTRGTADTAFGAKWQVVEGDENSGRPGMALLAHLDFASGSGPFRGQGTRPSLRWVSEWDLANDVGVGIMPGIFRDQGANGKYTGFIMAATVSKGWTDNFRTFAEIAGQQLTATKNGGNIVTFDVGATYLASKNLQWDISCYRGLNDRSPDAGAAIGVSIRF